MSGELRPVVACHCSQCRRAFTNYGAFTAAARDSLAVADAADLAWYDSSPGVRRGFCRRCGSALFWDNAANPFVSIAAGAFDQPSGLKQVRHIYIADKADFYDIADGLEQLPQGQGGDVWPRDGGQNGGRDGGL
ncbi:MAG: GFA family protein [Kiloniellaceae bacterium]